MSLTLYGIPNCDSCRAARRWLKAQNIDHAFHDVRADGLPKSLLMQWLKHEEGAKLLNRRGRSWRELSDAERARADTGNTALADLLHAHPLLMKRPVLTSGKDLRVGFAAKDWLRFTGESAH